MGKHSRRTLVHAGTLAGILLSLAAGPAGRPALAAHPAGVVGVAPVAPGGAASIRAAGERARWREAAARHRAELGELRSRLARADRASRPALQREIAAAKRAHAAELLALQAGRARAAGHEAAAARLERRRLATLAGGAGRVAAVDGGAR